MLLRASMKIIKLLPQELEKLLVFSEILTKVVFSFDVISMFWLSILSQQKFSSYNQEMIDQCTCMLMVTLT